MTEEKNREPSTLPISKEERAKFTAEGSIDEDSQGNEVLVGLDPDEAARLCEYLRPKSRRRTKTEAADVRYLRERHQRAMVFWRVSRKVPDYTAMEMSPEAAFDLGARAWFAYAGSGQILDFAEMVSCVPPALRSAALNGWLSAFDDEADKLKK